MQTLLLFHFLAGSTVPVLCSLPAELNFEVELRVIWIKFIKNLCCLIEIIKDIKRIFLWANFSKQVQYGHFLIDCFDSIMNHRNN